MTPKAIEPQHIPCSLDDDDTSTINAADTPPESTTSQYLEDLPNEPPKPDSCIPWPGSSFQLRCAATGHILTLIGGQVVLAPAASGRGGSDHWECMENNGWLGFRNKASGYFLGHNIHGYVLCSVSHHRGWERFCARITPEGTFFLLMTQWESLWYVGGSMGNGDTRLAKLWDAKRAIAWEFVKA